MTSAEWARSARAVQDFAVKHFVNDGRQKREETLSACDTQLRLITQKVIDLRRFRSECQAWMDTMGDQSKNAYLCEHNCAAPFMEIVKVWGDDTKAEELCASDFGSGWILFKLWDNMFTKIICSKNPVTNTYCYDAVEKLNTIESFGDGSVNMDECNAWGDLGCCTNVVLKGIPSDPELKAYYESRGSQWPTESADSLKTAWKDKCTALGAEDAVVGKMFVGQCAPAEVGDGIAVSTIPYTDADGEEHNGGAEAFRSFATSVTAGLAAAALAAVSHLL